MPDTNPQQTLVSSVWGFRLNRFEAVWLAWRAGQTTPDWQQHLPADDEPCSPNLIFFLLQLDIEFRVKAGMPALLAESYFEHPRLQRQDARLSAEQIVELIYWEYQQRWQIGRQARRAEYEAAFTQHADAVRELKPILCCPKCRRKVGWEESNQTFVCPSCGDNSSAPSASPAATID